MIVIASFVIFFLLALVVIWLLTRSSSDYSPDTIGRSSRFDSLVNTTSSLLKGAGVRTRVVFNGKEYSSPDEMPADVRQAYESAMGTVLADTDRNGIPDIFESGDSATFVRTALFTNASDDPTEKLKKLKEMRDSGLISAEEYESKKTEILNRM